VKRLEKPCTVRVEARIDADFSDRVDAHLLTHAARVALCHQGVCGPAELTLVVTDDSVMRQLNQTYRDVDAPTDVLSFWNEDEGDFVNPPGAPRYLGDVIVSFPRAEDQASQAGHSVEAELQLLTVHGVLHLLGHDHAEPDRRDAMWAAQAEILNELEAPFADNILKLEG
jgi:probable rRNA maturation factor